MHWLQQRGKIKLADPVGNQTAMKNTKRQVFYFIGFECWINIACTWAFDLIQERRCKCLVSSLGVYFYQFGSLLIQKNTQLGAKKGPGTYGKKGERDCGNASFDQLTLLHLRLREFTALSSGNYIWSSYKKKNNWWVKSMLGSPRNLLSLKESCRFQGLTLARLQHIFLLWLGAYEEQNENPTMDFCTLVLKVPVW